jgi:hypothetical protein
MTDGPVMQLAETARQPSRARGGGSPSAIAPRLLNLHQTAEYLGCSYWTARDYVLAGLLPVVNMPPLRARDGERPRQTLRRVLVDREDLDRFIESLKTGRARELQSSAPQSRAEEARVNRRSVPPVCPTETKKCTR